MSEQRPNFLDSELARRLLEYHTFSDEEKQGYLTRGIVPTENIGFQLDDEQPLEWAPGIPNPSCYKNRPWAEIIENFRLTHPDLWQEQKDADAQRRELFRRIVEILESRGVVSTALSEEHDEARWESARIKDQIFRMLIPELEAAQIDPFKITT